MSTIKKKRAARGPGRERNLLSHLSLVPGIHTVKRTAFHTGLLGHVHPDPHPHIR